MIKTRDEETILCSYYVKKRYNSYAAILRFLAQITPKNNKGVLNGSRTPIWLHIWTWAGFTIAGA